MIIITKGFIETSNLAGAWQVHHLWSFCVMCLHELNVSHSESRLKKRIDCFFFPIVVSPWPASTRVASGRIIRRSRARTQDLASIAPGSRVRYRSAKTYPPASSRCSLEGSQSCPAYARVYAAPQQAGGEANRQAIIGAGIRGHHFGRRNAEPVSLHRHHAQQAQVLLVREHRAPVAFLSSAAPPSGRYGHE